MWTIVQDIHGSTSLNLHHFKHQCFHKLTKMTLHFLKVSYFLKENNDLNSGLNIQRLPVMIIFNPD